MGQRHATPHEPNPPFRLESIPGVGPALAQRIRSAYGGDEAFRNACRRLDLDPLLALGGVSERRAFELAAHVRSDAEPELTRTTRARQIRRRLQDLLASYARTEYGRRAVRLLPVLRDPKAIAKHAQNVMDVADHAETVDRPRVQSLLSRLRRLRDPARPGHAPRLVVTDTEEDEMTLRKAGVDRWCRIATGRSAVRLVEEYPVVLYAYRHGGLGLEQAPNAVPIPFDEAIDACAPERDLAFVQENRTVLEAMADLAALEKRPSATPALLQAADAASQESGVDLAAAAAAALEAAQAVFSQRVESISIQGRQILDLLAKGRPPGLEEARTEAVAAGRKRFRELTGHRMDPFAEGLPLAVDEEEVARLQDQQEARAATEQFRLAREAAAQIAKHRQAVHEELSHWLRFDVDFALGCFAQDHGARPARTGEHLWFRDGANIDVVRDPGVQRIDYAVGGDAPAVVLTGANSGGKSTLLEQLAQFVILHHWGLPVPAAEAEVPILDEVLVFNGSRGLDAGAFETFLRELFPPVVTPGRKLILLDEVESVTELEAAGRILGVFLEEVVRSESTCVLVTHLPDEVLKHAKVPVRIDGIDAVGLDDRFNLVVDRQPKIGHRARSTPELIIRRMHARSQGRVQDALGRILDRWGS